MISHLPHHNYYCLIIPSTSANVTLAKVAATYFVAASPNDFKPKYPAHINSMIRKVQIPDAHPSHALPSIRSRHDLPAPLNQKLPLLHKTLHDFSFTDTPRIIPYQNLSQIKVVSPLMVPLLVGLDIDTHYETS